MTHVWKVVGLNPGAVYWMNIWTFFTLICCKIVLFVWKRPKINKKRLWLAHFLKRVAISMADKPECYPRQRKALSRRWWEASTSVGTCWSRDTDICDAASRRSWKSATNVIKQYFAATKHHAATFRWNGRPSLMVTRGYSCSEDLEFKSQHWMLKGPAPGFNLWSNNDQSLPKISVYS